MKTNYKEHCPFKNTNTAIQIATEVSDAFLVRWWILKFDNEDFLILTLDQLKGNGIL